MARDMSRWRTRFEAEGISGLYGRYQGAPRRVLGAGRKSCVVDQ